MRIVLPVVLLVTALLVAGCPVTESQMRACGEACRSRGVLRVTIDECTCGPVAVDGGVR